MFNVKFNKILFNVSCSMKLRLGLAILHGISFFHYQTMFFFFFFINKTMNEPGELKKLIKQVELPGKDGSL